MTLLNLNTVRCISKFIKILFFLLFFNHIFSTASYATHPLITDDTGTQGKGKFLFEFNGQVSFDRVKSVDDISASVTMKNRESEIKATVNYGIVENVDVIFGIPYQWKKEKVNDDVLSDVNGIADVSMEIKWRFFVKDKLSLAFKPGLTLPTGDKDNDLGAGKITAALYFIATQEINPWVFHINLGYKRNENKLEEREDIWHMSLAGEYKIIQNLKLVANIGSERNTDKSSNTNPAFLLGGFIYSIKENVDIDLGVKIGLTDTEQDVAYLGGIAIRF
ncbi:MAG: transporter [Syntrophaceae bacterium]